MSLAENEGECPLRMHSSHSHDVFAYKDEENADVKAVLQFMKPLLFFKAADGVQIGVSVDVERIKKWIEGTLEDNNTHRHSSGDTCVLKIQQASPDHEDWVEYQIRMRGKVYETLALTAEEFSAFKSRFLNKEKEEASV